MLESVVADRIWVSERPVKFLGVWLRARATVVKLESGGLWIHSPSAPTPELCEAIDALGPVEWLVVPNRFHHLATPHMARRYPDATIVAPASATARNADLTVGLEISDPAVADSLPEIVPLPLEGVPYIDETAFYDRPSQTLIGADLALCANHKDHWSWRCAAWMSGCYGEPGAPPELWLLRQRATARCLDAMLDRPIDRLLLAHTDPITERPAERLARAWRHTWPTEA